eukprot:g60430.t1
MRVATRSLARRLSHSPHGRAAWMPVSETASLGTRQFHRLFDMGGYSHKQNFMSPSAFMGQRKISGYVVSEVVPSLGDSITEGTVVEWTKGVGDIVQEEDVICVIETDKVSMDIRATVGGQITELAAKEGETVMVGAKLVVIDTSKGGAAPAKKVEKAPPKEAKEAAPAPPPPEPQAKATAPAPPQAAAAPAKPAQSKKPPSPPPKAPAAPIRAQPAVPGSRSERRVAASRMRQTIAKRLKSSQNTTASLTTFNEIDMSHLMALRNKYKDEFYEKHGVKLGFMSCFVKSATHALQKFPDVNAWLDDNELIYRDFVDISVAVGTPTGLVVPVMRNCESMSFRDVEATIADFGARARKGQLAMEEMAGGTFTISNGGVYGSLMGTPIINTPQSAILGMHGIFKRPVVVNDEIVIRPMMYVALTYDHRTIDGATAVQFLRAIKDGVEDPQRMLLDL